MSDVDKPRLNDAISLGDMRRLVMRHLKHWHYDAGARQKSVAGAESVSSILTSLIPKTEEGIPSGLSDMSLWPSNLSLSSGAKLDVSSPDGRSIFLPATPSEFFELLDLLESGRVIPEKFLRPVDLRMQRSSPNNEDFEMSDDDILERLSDLTSNAESIDVLEGTVEMSKLFGHSQLIASKYYETFNTRALFLFTQKAYALYSEEEINDLKSQIQGFKFKKAMNNVDDAVRHQSLAAIDARFDELKKTGFQQPVRPGLPISQEQLELAQKRIMDKAARLHFVERVRDADSLAKLHPLKDDVAKFPFLNRGELGIVRSVLNRKIRRFESQS